MRFEHNCVEDTQVGFAIVDETGFGFGTETFDLGGGELGSVGRNSFIGTDVDLAFLNFGFANTPTSTVVAENNYWDDNNPFAADPLEPFVVDQIGTAQWDTEPYRSNGPADCGLPPEG